MRYEMPADETEQGREFWGSLFGWQFQAYPGVPDMGRLSTCTDPHGNDFGLWHTDTSAPDVSQ